MPQRDFSAEHCQAEQGIPECQFIRQLITRINKLNANASSFEGAFCFDSISKSE
jgi:hypothetical protein